MSRQCGIPAPPVRPSAFRKQRLFRRDLFAEFCVRVSSGTFCLIKSYDRWRFMRQRPGGRSGGLDTAKIFRDRGAAAQPVGRVWTRRTSLSRDSEIHRAKIATGEKSTKSATTRRGDSRCLLARANMLIGYRRLAFAKHVIVVPVCTRNRSRVRGQKATVTIPTARIEAEKNVRPRERTISCARVVRLPPPPPPREPRISGTSARRAE